MAIYHLNVRRCSKNKGQSASAKFNYINREDKYNKKRDDLIINGSGNIPEFAKNNPSDFWKYADQFERDNARVCTEIEFALPRELNTEQQVDLVNEFIKNNLDNDQHKLAYSFAIHSDKDNHNPHCHLIFSERNIDGIERAADQFFKRANSKNPELGGAKKSEHANKREFVQNVRTSWRVAANKHLANAGINETIDDRTLKAQGIDRPSPVRLNRVEFKELKILEAQNIEIERRQTATDVEIIESKINDHYKIDEEIRKEYEKTENDMPTKKHGFLGLYWKEYQKEWITELKTKQSEIRANFERNRAIIDTLKSEKNKITEVLSKIIEKNEVLNKTLNNFGVKPDEIVREVVNGISKIVLRMKSNGEFESKEQKKDPRQDIKQSFKQTLSQIKSKSQKAETQSRGMKI